MAKAMATIVMAGGGTGGHVMPLLAVARELRARGHQSRLHRNAQRAWRRSWCRRAGFPLELIEIGGLNRVGVLRTLRTLAQLPFSVRRLRAVDREASAGGGFQPGRLRGGTGGAGRAVETSAAGGDGAERDAGLHESSRSAGL